MQKCAYFERRKDGTWEVCEKAGSHADPAFPKVRRCVDHKEPGDVLMIERRLSSEKPPLKAWGEDSNDD